MGLVWALRIALYAQFLLGFDRIRAVMGSVSTSSGITQDLHLGLGVIIAALALVAMAPVPGNDAANPSVRPIARFLPLAPLLIGLGFRFAGLYSHALMGVHVLLAFAVMACVEISAARQRRAIAT